MKRRIDGETEEIIQIVQQSLGFWSGNNSIPRMEEDKTGGGEGSCRHPFFWGGNHSLLKLREGLDQRQTSGSEQKNTSPSRPLDRENCEAIKIL